MAGIAAHLRVVEIMGMGGDAEGAGGGGGGTAQAGAEQQRVGAAAIVARRLDDDLRRAFRQAGGIEPDRVGHAARRHVEQVVGQVRKARRGDELCCLRRHLRVVGGLGRGRGETVMRVSK